MVQAFIENPILLLFIVVGIGYGIGSIKLRGTGLGVAAVLFVGLFFGSLDQELHIPEEIIFLGLSIFIYSVGLSSGPSFFQLFRQRGSRDLVFIFGMLSFSALITVGFHYLFLFEPATSAGLFAGSTTNTPALAGVLDQISNSIQDATIQRTLSEWSVIAYSLSYPMGVIAPMLAIQWMQRLFKIDYREEERQLRKTYPVRQDIASYTIIVKKESVVGKTIRDLKQDRHWTVIFGRLDRDGTETLSNWDTIFQLDDKVAVVGDREEVDAVAAEMGEMLPYKLSYDQSEYATEQIFVSNDKIAGKKLAGLNLSEKFSVLISRVTRGDIDLLANSDTVLEMGDRVRLVTRRKDMPQLKKLLGNSFEQLSKIDLLSFGFGLALGLMLGMVNIEIPGGINFRLGYAGGPIIVGLVLGGLRRTGPINWQLPYGANVLLRQLGLILLLAGIGVNSGHQFVQTIARGEGGWIFLAAAIISLATALSTLIIGYKVLKIPFSFLIGMVSSQPATLEFALSKANNKLPNLGFTIMMPISIITKIIFAQFLFAMLT